MIVACGQSRNYTICSFLSGSTHLGQTNMTYSWREKGVSVLLSTWWSYLFASDLLAPLCRVRPAKLQFPEQMSALKQRLQVSQGNSALVFELKLCMPLFPASCPTFNTGPPDMNLAYYHSSPPFGLCSRSGLTNNSQTRLWWEAQDTASLWVTPPQDNNSLGTSLLNFQDSRVRYLCLVLTPPLNNSLRVFSFINA